MNLDLNPGESLDLPVDIQVPTNYPVGPAILRGDYYERHVKPAAEAENERQRAAKARNAVFANHHRKTSFTAQVLYFDPQAGPALPEEIEAL